MAIQCSISDQKHAFRELLQFNIHILCILTIPGHAMSFVIHHIPDVFVARASTSLVGISIRRSYRFLGYCVRMGNCGILVLACHNFHISCYIHHQ